ncbi:transposable element Tcb2 transposase [Trichonephila clavipes]|nr:transposable element Tcb2 transposase [Trichonephila clavipes]
MIKSFETVERGLRYEGNTPEGALRSVESGENWLESYQILQGRIAELSVSFEREWNQVVFNDESRFNLSSDDNRVRVWRPRGERLNPTFALQRHTALTAGVMVWGAIAYNARSPLVLIFCTMTAQRYVHDIFQPHVLPLIARLSWALFNKTMLDHTQQGCHKTASTTLPPFSGLTDPQICHQSSIYGIICNGTLDSLPAWLN